MKPSGNFLKCGSKRKNHVCGLGLCPEVNSIDNDKAPKKKKKLEITDKNTFQKMKSCRHCGRAVQGHPLPRGDKCNLTPLPEKDYINSEKRKKSTCKEEREKQIFRSQG